jgi:hypothetical protein
MASVTPEKYFLGHHDREYRRLMAQGALHNTLTELLLCDAHNLAHMPELCLVLSMAAENLTAGSPRAQRTVMKSARSFRQ